MALVNGQLEINKRRDHRPVHSLNDVRICTRRISEGAHLENDLLHPIGCPDSVAVCLQFAGLLHPLLSPGNKFNDLPIQLINFCTNAFNT